MKKKAVDIRDISNTLHLLGHLRQIKPTTENLEKAAEALQDSLAEKINQLIKE